MNVYRIDLRTGCHLWQGANVKGYACKRVNGKTQYVHRLKWADLNGPIPTGMHVLHSCDRGSDGCVNPSHLFVGTNADNMADKMKKGRHRYGNLLGLDHPHSKLSPESVRDMRIKYEAGMNTAELADEFGVNSGTVWLAVHRRTWKHVP